jgi:HAD superfamily hydrolase (TIGR01549 family)
VILFDFGGTLDANGERWCVRFHRAYLAHGGRLPLPQFEQRFRQSDRMLERLDGIRRLGFGAMAHAQTRLLRELTAEDVAWNAIAEAFRCESSAAARANRSVLARIAAKQQLGIVSNVTGNLELCLAELGLLDLFAVVADSAMVGIAKPDPGIFRHALAAAGARVEDSWMVGDNFEADVRPAARLGLMTAWLAPPDRPVPTPGIATARIARLADLEPLVA